MRALARELRLAVRGLARARSFSATVVVTLAVGVGLGTAIFTVVDCVLLRPLAYRDADRIVAVETRFTDQARSIPRLGGEDYNDLRRGVKGFEATAWYNSFNDGMSLRGAAVYGPVAWAAPQFFKVLGVEPVVGRAFRASDERGTDAVVSEGFALAHWGSARAALGASITYTGEVYTVVGVAPKRFGFPGRTEVWFERPADVHEARSSYSDHVVGRRRAGVSEAQLEAELRSFGANLARAVPEDRGKEFQAVSLREQLVGPVRPTLELLMGGAGLLLLVVCANLANLLLVRTTQNARALTIRTALGAGRMALARAALLETGVLAVLGATVAIAVAEPTLALLKRLAPADLPRLADVRLNGEVFAFGLGVSAVVMVAATMLPLWRAWHADPAEALRGDAARGGEGRGTLRLREAFLMGEIALTLLLSVAAVVLAVRLRAEDRQELGFQPSALVLLDTHQVLSTPPPADARDNSEAEKQRVIRAWEAIGDANVQRAEAALATVKQMPGVASADAMSGAPMTGVGPSISYAVRGRQQFLPGAMNLPVAEVRAVTPGVLQTLGVPLLRGRALGDEDREGGARVAVVSEALARQSFGGENPVGKQLLSGYDAELNDPSGIWTIVGVAGDVRGDAPGMPARPTIYIPLEQHPLVAADMQIVARVQGEPHVMAEQLAKRLGAAHADVAVQATTMREAIAGTERGEQFRSALFLSFAAVSLLLAGVGTYGVTAYTAEQRRREWALRMALGADRGDVLRGVLLKTVKLAGVGVVLGGAMAWAAWRVFGSLVGAGGVVPGPGSFALAAGLVLLLAAGAALVPARRASSVDPMTALRAE